jgi:formylglycine-generating enzyme required for sulfatase activity
LQCFTRTARVNSNSGNDSNSDNDPDSDKSDDEMFPPRRNILTRCDTRLAIPYARDLQEEFPELNVHPRIVFDHPTIESIAQHLCDQEDGKDQYPSKGENARRKEAQGWFPFDMAKARPFTQIVVANEDYDPVFCEGSIANLTKEDCEGLYEAAGASRYFRCTDGMECVLLPKAWAWIGACASDKEALPMEEPCHRIPLSSFLIDVEPVSIGAYARFLNLVQPPPDALQDWILLYNGDDRHCHLPLQCTDDNVWEARPGVPLSWPMIMVSWYGANAYSLWTNGHDWRCYRSAAHSFLPTEAQWEYAARGADPKLYPWGDTPATPELLNVCWNLEAHATPHTLTPLVDLPLVPVNMELGMSPWGIRHMAGNVMNWCRDTYDANFYDSAAATLPDAWNCVEEGLKTERGGNWVETAENARCSWRRGRTAEAKGRCLGFRCVGYAPCSDDVSTTAVSSVSDAPSPL